MQFGVHIFKCKKKSDKSFAKCKEKKRLKINFEKVILVVNIDCGGPIIFLKGGRRARRPIFSPFFLIKV